MSLLRRARGFRPVVAVAFVVASAIALHAQRAIAQEPVASRTSGPTSPEPVLGIAMGSNRRALNRYLVARGWVQVADSVADIGNPSVHAGTLAGRPAEIIAMFGASGRLVNLAINVPATSGEDLRAAYAGVYRLLERARCAATLPPDYASQLDSILRGGVPHLPSAGSVAVHKPLLPSHTTLESTDNTDWPSPTWANRDAAVGTRLTAVRLDSGSRWPYQVTVWSSVALMFERATMCADSRAAEVSAVRAGRDERLAARLAARRSSGSSDGAPLDSLAVVAGPGVTLRVDTLIVRGREEEPNGVIRILHRRRGSTIRYEARVESAYDSLEVMTADTIAASSGMIVVDGNSFIGAMAQPRPRAETKRLYELMRAELVSNNPVVAYVAVECEMERLLSAYPATAHRWISAATEQAHNPERDMKAMRRLDAALGGHLFGGCADDRKRFPGSP